MRIVIEIDPAAVKHAESGETNPPSPADGTAAPADGGAAPNAPAGSTAAADTDSGGPSQELLQSIGAAERGNGDGTFLADATDAGAAPTEL